ncbi:FAD-dependent oxidoreductase [Micromonospora sp. CPCC 205558]|uniref:FAD-dependent oxidoreductase n=1 Tax=Micromonospora sp. CPCC 205558 TaxID=3122403 RepID=UPI002FEFE582
MGLAPSAEASVTPAFRPPERPCYIEGAWTSPRYGTAGYNLLLQPAGRVYFAGDWLSHEVAWQHGAFVAARSAVSALHQRVMAG